MRKGQGLPLNTIIVAIIVIVVLVVIILIFTGQLDGFMKTLRGGDTASATSCVDNGGRCVASFQCGDSSPRVMDCGFGLVCCSDMDESAIPPELVE